MDPETDNKSRRVACFYRSATVGMLVMFAAVFGTPEVRAQLMPDAVQGLATDINKILSGPDAESQPDTGLGDSTRGDNSPRTEDEESWDFGDAAADTAEAETTQGSQDPVDQAEDIAEGLEQLGGGMQPPLEPSDPRGNNIGRDESSETPEQYYENKTNPHGYRGQPAD